MNYLNLLPKLKTPSDRRREVIRRATMRLSTEENFDGICMDNFPSDEMIQKDINESVQQVIDETLYWMGNYP